jgi:thioredoxin-related protein
MQQLVNGMRLLWLLLLPLMGLANQPVEWLSWEELGKRQAKEARQILVLVQDADCGWCSVFEKQICSDSQVQSILNQDFYCVKLNIQETSNIYWNGRPFKWVDHGRQGYHQLAAELLRGQLNLSAQVYLNKTGQLQAIVPELLPVREMLEQLTILKQP